MQGRESASGAQWVGLVGRVRRVGRVRMRRRKSHSSHKSHDTVRKQITKPFGARVREMFPPDAPQNRKESK